jgi:hypothetical protein
VTGGGGTTAGEAGGGTTAGEAGGGSIAGKAGGGAVPDGPLGSVGETGTSGGGGTTLGLDGLKVGGGGGGMGLTVCARAWPIAKAAIIAASKTAAKGAAAGRAEFVAAMPISLSLVGRPNTLPHQQQIGESSNPHNPLIRGHPSLKISAERKTWMAGTSPAMTDKCIENRAGFCKRDMNPPKNKLWDSEPGSRSCFAGDSLDESWDESWSSR